jgi:hypothetical protein
MSRNTDVSIDLLREVESLRKEVERLRTQEFATIEVKKTTGDPTGFEGRLVINTVDNRLRIYADGVWRNIITW